MSKAKKLEALRQERDAMALLDDERSEVKTKVGICDVCGRYRVLISVEGAIQRCHPMAYQRDRHGLSYCDRAQQKNLAKLGRVTR